ncbi:hypothetical protein Tco_0862981 [Tanacetum coccineum]
MSDFEDSTVTYTAVSSPFADFLNIRLPGVDGPPMMPEDPYAYVVAAFQAPPSLDYVSGPEYPPSPNFVSEPVYPEFMPLEDEILPVEEQPLPAAISPTADSLDYVPDSDPEEDLEEHDNEDPEEDLADYPVDGGDNGDDEDESYEDDEDEEAPSAEETEPFETDESAATPPPHPAYRVTARISIKDETPISLPPREEIPSLLLPPILSPLPVSPPLPQISSPPLPVSSPVPVLSPPLPASPIRIALGPRYEVGENSSATARPTGGLREDYDTDEISTRLDDKQPEQQLMVGRLNMLYRDRCAHARTARLIEAEARMRQAVITEMLAADRRRKIQFIEALKLLKKLQTQMTEFERQQGPAKGPTQPDALEKAGSSS